MAAGGVAALRRSGPAVHRYLSSHAARVLRAGAIAALTLLTAASAAAQAHPYFAVFGEAGSRRPGWRMGWNEDRLCYPTMGNCEGRHGGFTWVDRVASGGQTGFGIAWGSGLGAGPRLEIGVDATLPSGEVGGESLGNFYLDDARKPFPDAGTLGLFGATEEEALLGELAPVERDPDYTGATYSRGFSGLGAATATVNFLYDFRELRGFAPTFGIGFGYSVVTARLRFNASYAGHPDLETASDSRFVGRSVALRLTLGAHRRLSDRFGVGLEGVLTRVGEAAGTLAAEMHPSSLESGQAIRDLRRFALRLVVRTYY